jgi:hypothetical protein
MINLKKCIIIIGFLCFTSIIHGQSSVIYVSINGNDANIGSFEKPFATIHAARNAIRTAKQKGVKNPIEVVIRGGVYYLNETLELGAEDSGTKDAPITYRSAENEKVILSGGKPISGKWQLDKDGKTWFIALPETKGWVRNIEKPELYQKNPSGAWHFRQLFVDEQIAIRARFPNKSEKNPYLYATEGAIDHIIVEKGIVKSTWGEEYDAQINIVPNWRFFNQLNDIKDVDIANSKINIGPRERHTKVINGDWFWIEGVKSELDEQNEWYLDSKKGFLYYMPLQGQDPNKLKFTAPNLNRIVYLKGDVEKGTHVKFVNFSGIEFRHTTYTLGHIEARVHTDGAILFENAQNCNVQDCIFENIGGYALWLHLDSKDIKFHKNTVLNSGGGGVLMTGARLSYMDDSKIFTPGLAASKVAPYKISITHNVVKHCGKIRYYGGGVHIDSRPSAMTMFPGNYIAHNHFQDLSRNGVFSFRNQGGNVVEFNEIHDCMQTTIDGAAIHFASMNRFNTPNYILNNHLFDVWGFEQKTNGKPVRKLANAIFLDWATSNTTVKNNVIYNTAGEQIKPIMGNWNLNIEDNYISEKRTNFNLSNEVGPKGTASNYILPSALKNTGGVVTSADSALVSYAGNWEKAEVTGFYNLFQYTYLIAKPQLSASCSYQLQVTETGFYEICLMYFPNDKNASNAKITIHHSNGVDTLKWNFRKGDKYGFAVKLGKYYFEKNVPASVMVSNEEADGFIVADGVGFFKVD